MLDPELKKYIELLSTLTPIPNFEDVRAVLLNAGWDKENIEDALYYLSKLLRHKRKLRFDGSKNPMAAFDRYEPISSSSASAVEADESPDGKKNSTLAGKPKRPNKTQNAKKKILYAAFFALFLSVVVFAAYFWRIGPFGKAPLSGEELVENLSDYVSSKSFEYEIHFKIQARPIDAEILPEIAKDTKLDKFLLLGNSWQELPQNVNVSIDIEGTYDKKSKAVLSETINTTTIWGENLRVFEANLTQSDEGVTFVQVEKFPASILRAEPFFGEWIRLPEDSRFYVGYGGQIQEILNLVSNTPLTNFHEFSGSFLDAANRTKIASPVQVSSAKKFFGGGTFEYEVKVDEQKSAEFYRFFVEEFESRQKNIDGLKWNNEMSVYLSSTLFKLSLAQILDRGDFKIILSGRRGVPFQIKYSYSVRPPLNLMVWYGKEIYGQITVMIKERSDQEISLPTNSISLFEAMARSSDSSLAEVKASQQVRQVNAIRDAISSYIKEYGRLPNSLQEITAVKDSKLSQIPYDVYSGEPYDFTVVGGDYELRFELRLEENHSKDSSKVSKVDFEVDGEVFRIMNGLNVAWSYSISK
ncbi:MAG: hypothetical protein Q8P52_02560 [bacterium]|nr:hypothetical protein [bacterium]